MQVYIIEDSLGCHFRLCREWLTALDDFRNWLVPA